MAKIEPPDAYFLGDVVSLKLLNLLCALFLIVVVFAHLVWCAERRKGDEFFPYDYLDGIDDSMWWSIVTVTTVGYGDKVPRTATGRLLAMMLMFLGIIVFAIFAGEVHPIPNRMLCLTATTTLSTPWVRHHIAPCLSPACSGLRNGHRVGCDAYGALVDH